MRFKLPFLMELSVVSSRPLISDIIKGFFAVRKAVISPTKYKYQAAKFPAILDFNHRC
jgi:hypothetical protein